MDNYCGLKVALRKRIENSKLLLCTVVSVIRKSQESNALRGLILLGLMRLIGPFTMFEEEAKTELNKFWIMC